MNDNASLDHILKKVLDTAALFLKEKPYNENVLNTYGYFTQHFVSGLNQKRLRQMLKLIEGENRNRSRPLKVLDIACGGGLISCAVALFGCEVLGIDINADDIVMAEAFAEKIGVESKFRVVDVITDPAWEESIEIELQGKPDIIILAYALHHLPEVEIFVERLARWLDHGAKLIVNEENTASISFRVKHMLRTLFQKDTDIEWHRSYNAWRDMLEASGFRVSAPFGFDLMPVSIFRDPVKSWSVVFKCEKP